MAYSRKSYIGDNVTKLFTVTFPYIDRAHVTVLVNDVEVPFTWQSSTQVLLNVAPGSGATVLLKRNSQPTGRLVDFTDDSMATEEVFDRNSDQLLFLTQETLDFILADTIIADITLLRDAAQAAASAAAGSAAAIALPLPIASGGTAGNTAATARTNLGLGDAATKTAGNAVGNLVQVLTGGKLPVLDGSNLTALTPATGEVVAMAFTPLATMLTGTTLIPTDDTIPQVAEGIAVMTASYTPKKAGNKIFVEYSTFVTHSVAGAVTAALFKDADTDASSAALAVTGAAAAVNVGGMAEFVAGSVAMNFALRVGGSAAGTTTVNGVAGVRRYGGVLRTYIRIIEVAV